MTIDEVASKLKRARLKFENFHSAHEGLAVIEEEFLELREEVFKSQKIRDMGAMREEAIQIAAMAMRFVEDICDERINR